MVVGVIFISKQELTSSGVVKEEVVDLSFDSSNETVAIVA